jgi:hypothetical protein
MELILGFLKTIFSKDNSQFLLMAALAIVCMMWFRSCDQSKKEKAAMEVQQKLTEQNNRALTDSIKFVKDKAGDIEAVKSSFVAKLSDLESLNRDLYNESKKENGKLLSIIKSSLTASSGNVVISNELKKYTDGKTYGLFFEKIKTDSGMIWNIKGESKFKLENNTIFPGQTEIFNNQMKLKIVLGFKTEKNGDYRIFARSGSPNVRFDSLESAILIPKHPDPLLNPPTKNKKFGIGLQIGYGIGTINKQVVLTPFVGVGISYNILKF